MTTLLIDGNSLLYRAYFALPTDMATASGQVTNAVYGFTSMLANLVRDHQPSRVAVAFDLPEPTFRHDMLESYKGQRDATPDLLLEQFGLVHEVLDALAIARITLPHFEADDIIATLATRLRDAQESVLIVTGDRDSYQLVEDPWVQVLYNKRGVSDYALYDEAGIWHRTGVTPGQYVDYAALRGDPSDNLPGVPGVGEKTAAKLINAYGDVAGVLAHASEQTPKLRDNLEEFGSRAQVNVDLMRLVRDAPVVQRIDELEFPGKADEARLRKCFALLEFRGMLERFDGIIELDQSASVVAQTRPDPALRILDLEDDCVDALNALREREGSELVVEVTRPSGFLAPNYFAFTHEHLSNEVFIMSAQRLESTATRRALQGALDAGPVVGHGIKETVRWLLGQGVEVTTLRFDTMLALYLLEPGRDSYSVDELCGEDSGGRAAVRDEQGTLSFGGASDGPGELVLLARHVQAIQEARPLLESRLSERGMLKLLCDIEVPLVGVLARMEHVGVGVDVSELHRLADDLTADAASLATLIQKDAGETFNVNSPKQLRTILYENLALTPGKKTKTGYSTDAATLEKLRGTHPIIEHLLAYRELEKLRSTYAEGLLAEVASDGRIHATFNQTVARTGRLSSDRPNLHNIPVRSERGRAFRRAFVPREGCELLVADYNQIELRCIAHLSGDPGLVGAFARGEDVHTTTAAAVFGVDPSAVTAQQRARAKMVSYGLAYGMESYGLAQRLGIEVFEASTILHDYFSAFPKVRSYMDATVDHARERGYTETLFGRRRPIPELASPNARLRAAGERQAMNAGIQGLAADIFKIALVRLDAALRDGKYQSTLILQVHDEVLLEVPPDEHDVLQTLTQDVLSSAADLSVPLEIHLAFGRNWADAKG